MPKRDPLAVDTRSPPFDHYASLRWLESKRRGHKRREGGRYQLFSGREKQNPVNVLIKVMSKPGRVYEQDLENEWETLATINRELPDSRYFPFVHDHGRLPDGRLYLVTSLFDEFPLVTTIGPEPDPSHLVTHLRIGIEIARALHELHGIEIFHVDLNPMNVLCRPGVGRPVVRLVDFESSYDRRRRKSGSPYQPPMTPGYSAPEVRHQAPDARADVYSLAAVIHTMLAGYHWPAGVPLDKRIADDAQLDDDLRTVLLKAVDPDPDRRFADVRAFEDALGAYLEQIWPGRTW